MTSSIPKKKLLKGGESWNKAIPVLLIRPCSWQDILHITGRFIPKVLRTVWHSSTTIHESDSIVQCSGQSLFLGDVLEFCIQKVFHCLANTSLYFTSPAISRCISSFVGKNNRRNPLTSFLFVLSRCFWAAIQWGQHLPHSHFFCHCAELIIRLTSKLVTKLANTCFGQRRWTAASFCSSLSKETLQFLLTELHFKKKKPLHYESRHVSEMTTAASC